MNKVTVGFCKSKGINFVMGDMVEDNGSFMLDYESVGGLGDDYNHGHGNHNKVEEFAWRENNGELTGYVNFGCNVEWLNKHTKETVVTMEPNLYFDGNVVKWRPHLPSLQKEFEEFSDETVPLKTRTKFIEIDPSEAAYWFLQTDETVYYDKDGDYKYKDIQEFIDDLQTDSDTKLYRKVEEETWRYEAREFICNANRLSFDHPLSIISKLVESEYGREWDEEYLELCRVILRAKGELK